MKTGTIITSLCCAAIMGTTAQAASVNFRGYTFDAYVIDGSSYRFPETWKGARPHIYVREGQEYTIVVNNPLPVRCAVAVTVDGLNTIDGKRTSADKAQKWMIEPNGSLTLRGWQTGTGSLRRFVFRDESRTYAQWKQGRDHRNYTQNLGVIGVAYFWNSQELRIALNPPRVYKDDAPEMLQGLAADELRAPACKSQPAPCAPAEAKKEAERRAGTGMGHKERNDVESVEFHYDSGMYAGNSVLAIYYEFAQKTPQPSPFEDSGNFAPDMYE